MDSKNLQVVQIVNASEDISPCSDCGNNLIELGHHVFTGKSTNTATEKDEICICKKCGKEFVVHYDFFDKQGHINGFVFTGDVNNLSFNWQDQLTPEQKLSIEEHLKNCSICSDRLEHEIISDAFLASLIHSKKTGQA